MKDKQMFEKPQKTAKELRTLIIMGICPHCGSMKIKYREYITNRTFGFECFNCRWTSEYNFTELKEASVNWFPIEQ